VVLKVRCLTARCLGDWFDVFRPAPSRLEYQSSNLAVADLQNLDPTVWKFSNFIGLIERLVL
jgi:hypothetical protein